MKSCALVALLLCRTAFADAPTPSSVPRESPAPSSVSREPSPPTAPVAKSKRSRRQLGLFVGGGVTLSAFYLPAFAFASYFAQGELLVPVLGPLIDLRRCDRCTAAPVERGVVAGLVLDSLGQAAGLSMLILGALEKHPRKVALMPTIGGVKIVGQF